jgi:hypothetical protein
MVSIANFNLLIFLLNQFTMGRSTTDFWLVGGNLVATWQTNNFVLYGELMIPGTKKGVFYRTGSIFEHRFHIGSGMLSRPGDDSERCLIRYVTNSFKFDLIEFGQHYF